MRRWNGWGDESVDYPLPDAATDYLSQLIGPASTPRDAFLDQVLHSVPPSRLPQHDLISHEPIERLRHARGQSLPDWIALRSGRITTFPDGVAFPSSEEDVQTLIQFAAQGKFMVIPYGGGTSVVGHINPQPDERPTLTVDMRRMNRMHHFDGTSHLATFGAGVTGPDLEAQLRAQGFTLGHYPQSFELSTLGGWIATRSSGQQSLGYGRIEDLFAGGRLLSSAGVFDLPSLPASAAGPDLRHIVLGSEGRLGIITEATVRASPLPEKEDFHALFFPEFESGFSAVRKLVQERLPLSMLRLSTAVETATTLALAGRERLISALERLLALRGVGEAKCMALLGFSGSSSQVKAARKAALGVAKEHGAVHVGRAFGKQWHKDRFRTPYLRNSLWRAGYAVDTVETATNWTNVLRMIAMIEASLVPALEELGERVHVFTHLSHLYRQGASIYTTYLFRLAPDPDETLARWQTLKSAVSQAILSCNGTISHQHGVGTDHLPYLEAEKGALGVQIIGDLCRRFDPHGLMNPGKLIA